MIYFEEEKTPRINTLVYSMDGNVVTTQAVLRLANGIAIDFDEFDIKDGTFEKVVRFALEPYSDAPLDVKEASFIYDDLPVRTTSFQTAKEYIYD